MPVARVQVLVQQPDVFVKAGTAFFPGSSLTGNGLLVSDGEVWRKQRRLSNPAFRKAAVDRYVCVSWGQAYTTLEPGQLSHTTTAVLCNRLLQRHLSTPAVVVIAQVTMKRPGLGPSWQCVCSRQGIAVAVNLDEPSSFGYHSRHSYCRCGKEQHSKQASIRWENDYDV